MPKPFRIAFALRPADPSAVRSFGVGAHRFAHQRLDWAVVRNGDSAILDWQQALALEPDGILGVLEPEHGIDLQRVGHSRVVILNTAVGGHPFHTVTFDNIAGGRMAARHLLERRLEHFAYVGISSRHFSWQRLRGFEAQLRDAGYTQPIPCIDLEEVKRQSDRYHAWVRSLRSPCGVLCANDGTGRDLIRAVRQMGLSVPNDLAVIGVSNDELSCTESVVTLTSISAPYDEIAYRGADHLDRLLRATPSTPSTVLVSRCEVCERESTRVYNASDTLVQRALLLIHRTHQEPMTVSRLVQELGAGSRRQLELRFRRALGRSPHQEILQARIQHAKRLLCGSAQSIGEIGHAVGFYDASQFSRSFKKSVGTTPTDYRLHHQIE